MWKGVRGYGHAETDGTAHNEDYVWEGAACGHSRVGRCDGCAEDSPAGVPGRGGDRRSGIGAEDAMVLRNASDASDMTRPTR